MMRTVRGGLAVLAFLIAAPAAAAGQEIPSGTWTGSITTSDGEFPVEFEVASSGDVLSVTMVVPESGETMPFESVTLDGDILTLGFTVPGVTIECELARGEDSSFAGDCLGSDGNTGVMRMVPPGSR